MLPKMRAAADVAVDRLDDQIVVVGQHLTHDFGRRITQRNDDIDGNSGVQVFARDVEQLFTMISCDQLLQFLRVATSVSIPSARGIGLTTSISVNVALFSIANLIDRLTAAVILLHSGVQQNVLKTFHRLAYVSWEN